MKINTEQATPMELTRLRACPFCGGDIAIIKAYTFPSSDLGRTEGPLFIWNVKIRCECCASIDHCETVAEAVRAWNGSTAPFLGDEYALDVAALEAKFQSLPEGGPDEEVEL